MTKHLALLAATSALAIASPSLCSIARDGEDDQGGGGGSAPAKSTMTKAEIDTLLDGTVDDVIPRLAALTPATRKKIAAAEDTRGKRVTLLAEIERLGDEPAVKPEGADNADDNAGDPPADDEHDEYAADQTTANVAAAAPDAVGETDTAAAAQIATGAEPTSTAAAAPAPDAPEAAPDVVRDVRIEGDDRRLTPEYVAELEQRLRDASAVEPVERIRGLVLEAGEPFGIEAEDGEGAADLVQRFLVAADKMRVDLGAKLANALEDVRSTQTKLANARKRNDPGALAKGRDASKARKIGADFSPLEGDDGEQSPLDKIMAGDQALELVFSNGANELLEFAPYDVRGTSFDRHSGGWLLRDPIVLKGSSDDTRVRGVALLAGGKQIAWAPFTESIRVPRNQEVNFDKMIVFK
jgi:hypothetical protein